MNYIATRTRNNRTVTLEVCFELQKMHAGGVYNVAGGNSMLEAVRK